MQGGYWGYDGYGGYGGGDAAADGLDPMGHRHGSAHTQWLPFCILLHVRYLTGGISVCTLLFGVYVVFRVPRCAAAILTRSGKLH